RNASEEDIKKAYRRLAHKHHPDKGGEAGKFKELNEAYQILSNREKKDQYDRFGNVFEGGQPGWDFGQGAGFGFENMKGGFSQGFDQADLGDLFEEFFGFGSGRRKKDFKKGKDIEIDIEINLEDTLKTLEKEISLYKMAVCSRCQGKGAEPGAKVNECFSCRGTGQVQQIRKTIFGSITRTAVCPECGGEGQKPESLCNVCKGEGRVKAEDKIRIFIPAGIDSNQMIKVEGRGEAGRKGGRIGDLYIRVFVKKHPVFKRKGDDLFVSLPISFSQAVLGDEVEAPTIDGKKILLKVPAGVESGKVLRISNKGITHFSTYGRGSMYIELIIKTPKKISKKQKELLEKLKEEGL
ncbi:MAG: molecular chaperone DnaJ, partial [Candidatus Pacearchaeota archaeon]|nr:molecular chaperone DnaJ [Candidatus Pacearchaeota archaeon]